MISQILPPKYIWNKWILQTYFKLLSEIVIFVCLNQFMLRDSKTAAWSTSKICLEYVWNKTKTKKLEHCVKHK